MGNAQAKGPQHKNRAHKKYVHWEQAVPPWPPGKPHLVPGSADVQPNVVTIRWEPPPDDGGAPITGYVVEHRKAGTPHWIRTTTAPVLQPELQLDGLEPGWRYQFRVTAQNAADLLSDPGELSQPLTVARAYRPATMAPQFSQELRDTVALENEKAEFTVHFHGIPTPKLVWYKDSFEIFSTRRMRVTVENDASSLVIHQTAFTDEGEYKCTATNRAGHIVTKAKLRLEAPPRIRIPRQYEDGLIFEKDEVIRLKVSVAGRPLPRTTWYHDGQPIPFGGRYEVSNTDRSSGLRISEAQRGDRGEYQVRATSRLGEDVVSFLVTVTDRPMPPGRPEVTAPAGRSVKLCWTEPDDDGGCKIGNYIVEYYRLGWNVWLKAATCRHLTTALTDLIEGSEYKFRVKAENPYGVSEPSCESAVVFIPDPKRGLLEQAVRGSASRTDILSPDQSARNTSEHKTAEDSLVGRRKYMEDNEDGETKPERSGQQSSYSKELKRELMERIGCSVTQQEMSDVTGRKNKENHERTAGNVRRHTHKNVDETDLQNVPEAPLRTYRGSPEGEKGFKASLQFTVAKRRDSSGERDSGVSEGSFSDGKQNLATSLIPREDDSLLHGSSELMLVLLPQTRDTHIDRDVECSSYFAGFGDSSVPPPLSLSAPELGSGDPWVTSPLRNAVSSTELLHEQAMARFYRAVAAEEVEKARQRKVIDPPAIPMEAAEFSRKAHTRTLELAPKQELRWHKGKQTTLQESWASAGAATHGAVALLPAEVHLQSTVGRKEPVRRYAEEEEVEEEEEEDEEEEEGGEGRELERIGVHRVTEDDDSKRRSIIGRGKNENKAREEEKEEDEMKLQEEEEEEQLEENIFGEFCENEELKEEESLGEEGSEFDEEEDLYKIMEGEESTQQSSGVATLPIERFAEQEDDTYHPRLMIALSKVSERQHPAHPTADARNAFPSILQHNIRFQENLEDTVHRKYEMPLREIERSPPRSFRESLPKELKPSFISDRRSGSISPFEPEHLEQSHTLPQEADMRREGYVRKEDDKVSLPAKAAPSAHRSVPSKVGSRISAPNPNGHIVAAVASTTESNSNTATPLVLALGAAKQKSVLSRKASGKEDTEASRAVADYYGDIIRDHARPKKIVRQYLNTSEMKAAARGSQQVDSCVSKSDPAATRRPEEGPEQETELGVETQTVTAEQSAPERYTATVQRPRTSRSKSRTSDVDLIRQASKDRSRLPSTERFSAKLSQRLPELARDFSPERTQPEELTEELRPASTKIDEHLQVNHRKWRSAFSYLADIAMFLVACWLYAFKDERLAIPLLVLMVYRQLHEAVKRRLPNLPQLPWKRRS